jgi:hypothetical protein
MSSWNGVQFGPVSDLQSALCHIDVTCLPSMPTTTATQLFFDTTVLLPMAKTRNCFGILVTVLGSFYEVHFIWQLFGNGMPSTNASAGQPGPRIHRHSKKKI